MDEIRKENLYYGFEWFAYVFVIVLIIVFFIELGSYIGLDIPIICYTVLFVSTLGMLITVNITPLAELNVNAIDRTKKLKGFEGRIVAASFFMAVILFFAYSRLCFYLNIATHSFGTTDNSFIVWAKYAANINLNSILFDAPSIFGFDISQVKPIKNVAKTLQWAYTISIQTVVITRVLHLFIKSESQSTV